MWFQELLPWLDGWSSEATSGATTTANYIMLRPTRPERFELPTFGSVDHFGGGVGCRRVR
jgi:hypothetical protein